MLLPTKIAKAKEKLEVITSLREHAKKQKVINMIRGGNSPTKIKIYPEIDTAKKEIENKNNKTSLPVVDNDKTSLPAVDSTPKKGS